MDNFTRRKTNKLAESYLRGDNGPLVSLSEINPDYSELLPKIKDITDQIIEERTSKIERNYKDRLEDLEKKYEKTKTRYNELEENHDLLEKKLEKVKLIYNNINKDKEDLSNLLSGL